jgi:transcriptional regulator with XRE-family HTH domain
MNTDPERGTATIISEDQREPVEGSLASDIGRRINQRRHQLGMSLRQLGAVASLSASSLSQIERGMVSPTLSSLSDIARALEVPLFDFFVGSYENSLVLKRGQHLRLELPGSNVDYELISRRGSTSIAVMRARLEAGHSVYDEPQSHPQEECLFVLRGQIEVTLGDETILLDSYDAIHFDASTLHKFTAVGDSDAEYILCISPVVV